MENDKPLIDEFRVNLIRKYPQILSLREEAYNEVPFDEMTQEEKERLNFDRKELGLSPKEYQICISLNADCFGTNCPKAKRLEERLSKEIIEIIKEYI